uniref:Uncharacterized protein n=1 Tax=Fagus sylvatica TaxID=28930 RepID=A0A2N9FNL3_FAGSY
MALGSRGVGAVFVCFSGEDSGQTGKATGEPRVPRSSWSFHLSNAPGLADQLVFAHTVDLVPNASWYRRKSCITLFLTVLDSRGIELGFARYGSVNRGRRSVFGPSEGDFPVEIPARPGKILTIREFHAMSKHVLFPTCPNLQINLFGPQSGQKRLGRTSVKLGQPRSNLVKVGQTSSNSGKCASNSILRLFDVASPVGSDRLSQTPVKPGQIRSTPVELGQSWSNLLKLREMCFGPRLEVILMWRVRVESDWTGPGCLVLCANTRENPGGKNGL